MKKADTMRNISNSLLIDTDSMYRFNAHDRRLERSLEVALMLMEAFRGFEHKFAYRLIGHSGDGANIEFVTPANYPRSEKDEFEVINKMRAHSQYCLSGGT